MEYLKLILPTILFVLSELSSYSQNLVANGSFEDVNTCTEADAECAPEAWMTTSPFVLLYGRNTNKTVAFEIFNTSVQNTRKYLQTKLLCPLIKDKRYRFSLRLLPGSAQVESIGALFSDSIIFHNRDVLINIKPTIDFASQMEKVPKKNRSAWNKFTVDFVAKGFEKYLIIGNFQSDKEQKRTFIEKPKAFTSYHYVIDDVELIPIDSIEICTEFEITREKLYSLNDRHPLKRENLFGDDEIQEPNIVEIIPTMDTIRFSSVLFEFDSFLINSTGKHLLDSIITTLDKENIDYIKIHGHTDSIGGQDYNLKLSLNRANAISEYLLARDFSTRIAEVQGFGDQYPLEPNDTEFGRQKNRRVEIIIKYKNIRS